jgi:hypothetical protein
MRRAYGFLGVAAMLLAGCGGYNFNQLGPTPPGTGFPTIQGVLWRDGMFGRWLGQGVQIQPNSGITFAAVAAYDNINGDNQALQCSNGSNFLFQVANQGDPSPYYPNGHLQFDLACVLPFGAINGYQVSYGGGSGSASYSASFAGGLYPGSFVHVSIPFTSFNTYAQSQVYNVSLYASNSYSGPAPVALLNDLKWTRD